MDGIGAGRWGGQIPARKLTGILYLTADIPHLHASRAFERLNGFLDAGHAPGLKVSSAIPGLLYGNDQQENAEEIKGKATPTGGENVSAYTS